jgi:energy-coupling factor transporter ATP-binding protein EcfA2
VPAEIPADVKGTIKIDGRDIQGVRTAELARSLVILFEDPALQIVSLTVEDDVAFGPANFGLPPDEVRARVAEALHQMRLTGYELRNPRTLSGGEQQLLALSGILAMRPKYIAMDEPVAMLDPIGKAQVFEAVRHLRDQGTSVVITDSGSDIEDLCIIADSMIVLHKGRVVAQGTPGEIFAQRALVEEVGLRIPQVARLAWSLDDLNGGSAARNVVPTKLEEGIELVRAFLQTVSAPSPRIRRWRRPEQMAKRSMSATSSTFSRALLRWRRCGDLTSRCNGEKPWESSGRTGRVRRPCRTIWWGSTSPPTRRRQSSSTD